MKKVKQGQTTYILNIGIDQVPAKPYITKHLVHSHKYKHPCPISKKIMTTTMLNEAIKSGKHKRIFHTKGAANKSLKHLQRIIDQAENNGEIIQLM